MSAVPLADPQTSPPCVATHLLTRWMSQVVFSRQSGVRVPVSTLSPSEWPSKNVDCASGVQTMKKGRDRIRPPLTTTDTMRSPSQAHESALLPCPQCNFVATKGPSEPVSLPLGRPLPTPLFRNRPVPIIV